MTKAKDAKVLADEIEKDRFAEPRRSAEQIDEDATHIPEEGVDPTRNKEKKAKDEKTAAKVAADDKRLNDANAKAGPGRKVRKGDDVFYVMPKAADSDGGTRPAKVVNPGPVDPDPVGTQHKWMTDHPDKSLDDYNKRDKDEDPQPKVNLVVFIDGHPDTQWRKEVPFELPKLRSTGAQPGDLKPNTWHWPEQSPETQEQPPASQE